MKKLLSILFAVSLFSVPCMAQFGSLGKILKGAKTAIDAKKATKKGSGRSRKSKGEGYLQRPRIPKSKGGS